MEFVNLRANFVAAACLILSVVVVRPLLAAKSKPAGPAGTDRDYIMALAAADRFLHAWQTQDHEAGLLMLSDTAKQHTSENYLQTFFAPGASAQQAFEIGRGKKLRGGRYVFAVTLFNIREDRKRAHPRFSQLIVIRTGKDDWLVDKLP
jgi:hypothetical protein